ncbi:MAG: hypothetical protein ACR2I2_03850 [Bryobacteraceae bacterium]
MNGMNGADFYLICFAVGFLFSVQPLLLGGLHLPHMHFHLPHHAGGHASGKGGASPVNLGTIAAFLAWFGGAGYLLTRYSSWWVAWVIAAAVLCGLAGAAILFWFLARVLMRNERPLDPADYEMVGVLGRVSSPIRDGGTGEMIFSQEGQRRGVPVRSEDGNPVGKGAEVVVMRYERGIAYVREWDGLTRTEL